jgi:hypothetical protein
MRPLHEDPEHQPQADGHDRGIYQPHRIRPGAAAQQQHQTDHEHRVRAQTEPAGGCRVRLAGRHELVDLAGDVAGHPGDLRGGEPVPQRRAVRAVQPHCHENGHAAGQPDGVVREAPAEAAGSRQKVAADRQRAGDQPQPPHAFLTHGQTASAGRTNDEVGLVRADFPHNHDIGGAVRNLSGRRGC